MVNIQAYAGINLRELTKTEILYVMSLVVSFVLFFVAVGLLMSNAAGNVALPYAVLLTAVALSSSTLIIGVVKKRKTSFLEIKRRPVIPFIQVPSAKPVIVARPAKNEHIIQEVENNYRELKTEPSQPLITQSLSNQKPWESTITKPKSVAREQVQEPFKPSEETSAEKDIAKSIINEEITVNQETVEKKDGKFVCPNCKKEFSQPIFMANYDDSKQPKLVAHCPYCDQSLDIKQRNSEEAELLTKTFRLP